MVSFVIGISCLLVGLLIGHAMQRPIVSNLVKLNNQLIVALLSKSSWDYSEVISKDENCDEYISRSDEVEANIAYGQANK